MPLGLLCGQEPALVPVTLRSQTLSWPLWDPAASLGQFGGISAPPAPAITHGAWQDGGAGPCPGLLELPRGRGCGLGLLGQGERRLGGLPSVSDGPCGVVQRTSGSCQRCPEAGHEALGKTQSPGGSAGAAGSTGGAGWVMEPWHRYPVAAPGAIRTRCWAVLGPGGPHGAFQPQPPRVFSPLPVAQKHLPCPKSRRWGWAPSGGIRGAPRCAGWGLGHVQELGTETGRGWWQAGRGGTPSFLAEPAAVAPRHPHRHPPGCAERPENGASWRAQTRDHPPHHQGLRPRPCVSPLGCPW